jgi:glycosyltransferase involved in cell wall biosynthesis
LRRLNSGGIIVQKKLCIVTHTFLPHVGGIERVVYEQSKRLLKRRFELMVLTNRINTDKQYSYDGIKVQCYDSLSVGFRLGIPYPIPNVTSYKTFLEAVKSSSLIHAHGHPYLSSLLAAKLAKRYKKPFVLTQHNTFIEYNSIWDTVEKLNDLAVGKQVLKEAQKIIAVSNATRNYVLSLGADPEKVTVLHNGVDLERFKPNAQKREWTRKKLGIHPEETVVLTVRRLVYKNGIDTLIEAARTAIQSNRLLVFLVIGTGPDFNEVKAKIEQLGIGRNFKLAGFISDADLPAYYNAADFFVLPSKSGEGLPLVGLEAMACGLPLVATNVGGIGEVIMKDYGKLVPPDAPEAMAEAVLNFSSVKLSILREKLRQEIMQRFSWDKNVEKIEKIYEELI